MNYQTICPKHATKISMYKNFTFISKQIKKHKNNYSNFFKYQYKIEMFQHSMSSILFLYKTKGLYGMLKMIFKRLEEVQRMFKWILSDRSKDQRDDDAIKKDRKRFSQNELF